MIEIPVHKQVSSESGLASCQCTTHNLRQEQKEISSYRTMDWKEGRIITYHFSWNQTLPAPMASLEQGCYLTPFCAVTESLCLQDHLLLLVRCYCRLSIVKRIRWI
jgi:hypothetical protein